MSLPPPSNIGTSSLPRPRLWTPKLSSGTLIVFVVSAAYLTFFFHVSPASTDEGMIAAGAERILRGQIPYRDFFSELGPGSFYLQALIFKCVGTSVTAFRLTAWILGAVLTSLIYRLGKLVIPGPFAFLPPFVFVTTCYPFVYYVNHHWWGNLFFLLMLLCFAKSEQLGSEKALSMRRAVDFAAGAFAAFTLLCMQPKGAWAVVIGAAYLLLAEKLPAERSWSQALRVGTGRAAWFLSGTVGVMFLPAAYFGLHGALRPWAYDNFIFLFTNYLPYEKWPGVYSVSRFTHTLRWVRNDLSFQAASYFLGFYFYAVAGPALGAVGALRQIRRERDSDPLQARWLLLLLLAGLGSLASELHEPNILHLVWASPVILILAVGAWMEIARAPSRWRLALQVAAVISLVMVVLVAVRRVAHVADRNVPVVTRRGTLYMDAATAVLDQKWITAIEQAVPPGGDTFFFPYHAQYYFLTATRNPTRYDVLIPEFHTPTQFDEALASLHAQPPQHIFSFDMLLQWSPRAQFPDDPPDYRGPDATEKSLQGSSSRYQKTADIEGMEVWTLRK